MRTARYTLDSPTSYTPVEQVYSPGASDGPRPSGHDGRTQVELEACENGVAPETLDTRLDVLSLLSSLAGEPQPAGRREREDLRVGKVRHRRNRGGFRFRGRPRDWLE